MPDREKVIRGLECCYSLFVCPECPYYGTGEECDRDQLMLDALALLREQEPVEPEKGVWLHPTSLDCCCSVCGRQPEHEPGESVPLYPYCPDCGAKMGVSYDA